MCKDCILVYLHSESFDKNLDKDLYALNKNLKIKWPIKKKILSNKDKNYNQLKFKGI